jgi:hypothetical protein
MHVLEDASARRGRCPDLLVRRTWLERTVKLLFHVLRRRFDLVIERVPIVVRAVLVEPIPLLAALKVVLLVLVRRRQDVLFDHLPNAPNGHTELASEPFGVD